MTSKAYITHIFILCLLVLSAPVFCADKTSLPTFENSLFRITVDPSSGGRISSLVLKSDGAEWILPGNRGLLMDHVNQQAWPGELLARKYEYALETTQSGDPAIRLWTTIDGGTDISISGVKIEKTIVFQKDKPTIDVVYKLSNPTSDSKNPGLWIQNILSPGGVDEGKYSYRPTTIGPLALKYPDEAYKPENESRFDPTAGWLAALNPTKQQGLVFLMDYNYLKCLYCSQYAYTHEWWYEPVLLPPGKSFETRITIWPVLGLSSVEHASQDVVCQLDFKRDGKKVDAELACIPGPNGTLDVSASAQMKLLSYPDRAKIEGTITKLASNPAAPLRMKLASSDVAEKTNLILDTSLELSGSSQSFEMYRPGLAILFSETTYQQPRPKRIRERFKPENLAVASNTQPQILHLRGLFSDKYRLNEVADNLNAEIIQGAYRRGTFGSSITNFPTNYATLMSYNVIIADHIPMDGLSDDAWEMLDDYVSHGGILLFIGGPMCSIGAGEISEFAAKLLPVSLDSLWKTTRASKPQTLDSTDTKSGMWQYCLNVGQINADAKIVVGSRANPILLTRKRGKGVCAVYTPLALVDGKISGGFWESAGYPKWFAGVIDNLLRQTEKELAQIEQ